MTIFRLLLPALVAVAAVAPVPARAVPRHETACTATGTAAAGCYFTCIKGERVTVTVETTTGSITGTVRCGPQVEDVVTATGPTPQSGSTTATYGYTPDDSTDPANCYTSVAPGATVRISCTVGLNMARARGAGAAAGEIQYLTPLSALAPTHTAFRLAGTAAMTVADAGTGQAFTGAVAVIAQGVTNGGLLPETCAYGAGDIAVSVEGTGVGSLDGFGFGRYERVGEALHLLVDVPDLAINGVASEDATFELDVALSSPEPCALGTRQSALFAGGAAFGVPDPA